MDCFIVRLSFWVQKASLLLVVKGEFIPSASSFLGLSLSRFCQLCYASAKLHDDFVMWVNIPLRFCQIVRNGGCLPYIQFQHTCSCSLSHSPRHCDQSTEILLNMKFRVQISCCGYAARQGSDSRTWHLNICQFQGIITGLDEYNEPNSMSSQYAMLFQLRL